MVDPVSLIALAALGVSALSKALSKNEKFNQFAKDFVGEGEEPEKKSSENYNRSHLSDLENNLDYEFSPLKENNKTHNKLNLLFPHIPNDLFITSSEIEKKKSECHLTDYCIEKYTEQYKEKVKENEFLEKVRNNIRKNTELTKGSYEMAMSKSRYEKEKENIDKHLSQVKMWRYGSEIAERKAKSPPINIGSYMSKVMRIESGAGYSLPVKRW
jgi:hypothetical protein